jgi:hypothetical protein
MKQINEHKTATRIKMNVHEVSPAFFERGELGTQHSNAVHLFLEREPTFSGFLPGFQL